MVCIVLAKKDDMEQGMAQNLLGCEVLADVENLDCALGIVTNYKEWIFLRNYGDKICIDNGRTIGVNLRDDISSVAGKICAFLSGKYQ